MLLVLTEPGTFAEQLVWHVQVKICWTLTLSLAVTTCVVVVAVGVIMYHVFCDSVWAIQILLKLVGIGLSKILLFVFFCVWRVISFKASSKLQLVSNGLESILSLHWLCFYNQHSWKVCSSKLYNVYQSRVDFPLALPVLAKKHKGNKAQLLTKDEDILKALYAYRLFSFGAPQMVERATKCKGARVSLYLQGSPEDSSQLISFLWCLHF